MRGINRSSLALVPLAVILCLPEFILPTTPPRKVPVRDFRVSRGKLTVKLKWQTNVGTLNIHTRISRRVKVPGHTLLKGQGLVLFHAYFKPQMCTVNLIQVYLSAMNNLPCIAFRPSSCSKESTSNSRREYFLTRGDNFLIMLRAAAEVDVVFIEKLIRAPSTVGKRVIIVCQW